MVFINGDNNLDEYAFMDFNELELIGSDENINILVQYDRFEANSQANWSSAKRFYVTTDYDIDTINSTEITDLGEVDSGDYHTVVDFVNWGKTSYPADNYALIIWDHGSGWQKKSLNRKFQKSISSDDTSGSHISIANGDFELMLSEIKQSLGKKLDFLGFDACLMGMWELTYSSEEYSRFLAFSEETENASGWEYNTLLDLFKQSDKTAKSLCKSVVNSSLDSVGATISCIDLSYIPSLTENINNFALQYQDNHSIDFEILTAYSNTLSMETEEYYKDFGMFFNNLILLVNDDIKTQWIAPILNDYFSAVVLSKGKDTEVADYTKATGFTIFMNMGSSFNEGEEDLYLNSSWSRNTAWDDFITREFYFNADEYEVDDSIEEAYYNESLETTNHSIHRKSDSDFMKLNLKKGYSYTFEAECSSYDTYMKLLDEEGNTLLEDDDGGVGRCSKINYFSEINQVVYLETYTYEHETIALYSLSILEEKRVDDYPNSIEDISDSDILKNDLSAEINYINDVDVFYLDLSTDSEYTIETINDGLDDTILIIFDSNGEYVTENDDIDTNNEQYMSKIIFDPENNGRYYFFVKAYDDKTGKYKIKLTIENKCVETNSGIEICDGIDNDCNGKIDENLTIPDSDKQNGVCKGQKKICGGTNGWIEPDYSKIKNYESIEVTCDGIDNNCDGEIDDNLTAPKNINQNGVCKDSLMACMGKQGWAESYDNIENYSKLDDTNDKLDNNCDGQIDESYQEPSSCNYGTESNNILFIFMFFLLLIFIRKSLHI